MTEFIMQETEEMKTFGSVWKRYEPVAVLVRCKDCKHRYKGWCCAKYHVLEEVKDDFFCADGTPKDS